MFCHNCGISCPQYARFCHHCGTKLISEAPATAAVAQVVVPAPPVQAVPAEIPQEMPAVLPVETNQADPIEVPVDQSAEAAPAELSSEQPASVPEEPVQSVPAPCFPQYHIYQPVLTSPQENPYLPQQPIPVSTGKKGTHWIPIVIMVVLSLIGFGLFIGIPSVAAPESDTPWFQNENGVLYFNENLYDGSGELKVPEQVDGKPVTSLSEKCFASCEDLTTVILPDTLSRIEDQAFADCTSLRGIFIPEQVAYIGTGAFSDCTALEAVSIPDSVTEIKSGAFTGCNGLKYIIYGDSHQAWMNLYSDFIAPETEVHCTDGTYPHWSVIP